MISIFDQEKQDAECRQADTDEGRWSFLVAVVLHAGCITGMSLGLAVPNGRLVILALAPLGFSALGTAALLPAFIQSWFGRARTNTRTVERWTDFEVGIAGRVVLFAIVAGTFLVGVVCFQSGWNSTYWHGPQSEGATVAPKGYIVAGILIILTSVCWLFVAVLWCRAWKHSVADPSSTDPRPSGHTSAGLPRAEGLPDSDTPNAAAPSAAPVDECFEWEFEIPLPGGNTTAYIGREQPNGRRVATLDSAILAIPAHIAIAATMMCRKLTGSERGILTASDATSAYDASARGYYLSWPIAEPERFCLLPIKDSETGCFSAVWIWIE